MVRVLKIRDNGMSAAQTPSFLVECSNGKTFVIYQNKNGEWCTGGLGAMGAKYNNYSAHDVAEYLCNR